MALQDLLDQNKTWAEQRLIEDPEFFRRHVAGQKPRILLITKWLKATRLSFPFLLFAQAGPEVVVVVVLADAFRWNTPRSQIARTRSKE